MFDGKAFGVEMVEIVKDYVGRSLAPLASRMDALERHIGSIPLPKDGKDADEAAIIATVLDTVKAETDGLRSAIQAVEVSLGGACKAFDDHVEAFETFGASFRQPDDGKDGKSVSVDDVLPRINEEISRLVGAIPPAKPGEDGKSVDLEELDRTISEKVAKAVAAMPAPKDGKDADPVEVASVIKDEVARAVAAMDPPADGTSITPEDVRPMVEGLVRDAFAAIPTPKDGVNLAGMFIDRNGELIATLSNGETRVLGPVVGVSVDPVEVERMVAEKVAQIDRPKDGVDGLGFEDMTETLEDDGRTIVRRYQRGDKVREFRHKMAVVLDRGVFKEGQTYQPGDGVTWGGSFWIAQEETSEKPDSGKGFRLAVKRGRDGKDGVVKTTPLPVKV